MAASESCGSPRGFFCLQSFLRWHVCRVNFARKMFFELRIFLRKMLRNFPRNFRAFVLWVRKNPGKFPPNFPLNFPNFPAKKNKKKITDELLQERREKSFQFWCVPLVLQKLVLCILFLHGLWGSCGQQIQVNCPRKCAANASWGGGAI